MPIEVQGQDQLIARIDELIKRHSGKRPVVTVGYNASYAIFVHEDLEAYHKVGQAKFLEQPWFQLRPNMARLLIENMTRGMSFDQALFTVGLLLQRESQLLVPVDTGNLKGSAFTTLEHDG